MIELLVSDNASLPKEVVRGLHELRKKDSVTREMSLALNKEEKELMELVKNYNKEKDSSFDDTPLITRAMDVKRKRKELVELLDEQMKAAQSIYENVDSKITDFDSKTKEFKHLFTTYAHGSAQGKKKKKKNAELATLDGPGALSMDPNEPVYCVCRRVSFGEMVGCENPDCTVEWFHFGCVGLTEEPSVWYCDECKSKKGN
jgi:inhibitor of growth protein 4